MAQVAVATEGIWQLYHGGEQDTLNFTNKIVLECVRDLVESSVVVTMVHGR